MQKIAVVTGAGSGVGREIALRLARDQWDVALLGRRPEALAQSIELAGQTQHKLIPIPCDVSSEQDVGAMAARVHQELGEVGVLVNSAGVNVPNRFLEKLSVQDYRKIVDVNLNGAFLCIHAFLPEMRSRGSGTIVNIVSDAGIWANRVSGAAYIAAKFGLSGLTAAINAEERRNGIRACAIYPGEINTPLLDKRATPPIADQRRKMLQPGDVADCAMLAINLPQTALLEQMVLRPTSL